MSVFQNKNQSQNIYKTIFWTGYIMVISTSFIPLKTDLHNITFNVISFRFHFDQVVHAVVYALIYLYFIIGRYYGLKLFNSNSIFPFLVVILLLATITEAVQLLVPSRAFNFFDWIANLFGIGVGLGFGRLGSRDKKNRNELADS